ncbi:hypothetical protein BGX27_002199, partial [Mortierella sp. AM989]
MSLAFYLEFAREDTGFVEGDLECEVPGVLSKIGDRPALTTGFPSAVNSADTLKEEGIIDI